MENTIGDFVRGEAPETQEEVQERAAGQLRSLGTLNLQMRTIDRQRRRINSKVREAIELGRLLAATTQEKDREIRRLRDKVARAKAEAREVKDESEREEPESESEAEVGEVFV